MNDFDGVEILVVEDSDSDADLTLRALERCNPKSKRYRVHDGTEALAFIDGSGAFAERDTREHPRLILLDLSMPNGGGLDVLRSLRTDALTKTIPVVVMTESHQERDLADCYRLGANGFVTKPVNEDEFMQAIARIGMYWLLVNRIA